VNRWAPSATDAFHVFWSAEWVQNRTAGSFWAKGRFGGIAEGCRPGNHPDGRKRPRAFVRCASASMRMRPPTEM
jgi:hypothetical protein